MDEEFQTTDSYECVDVFYNASIEEWNSLSSSVRKWAMRSAVRARRHLYVRDSIETRLCIVCGKIDMIK